MKVINLLIVLSLLVVSCRKDNIAESKIQYNWKLDKFFVNDIDKTDSMKNITLGWWYSFDGTEHKIHGTNITGEWEIIGKNAEKLRTKIYGSTGSNAGPFLDKNINHEWDLNYEKLCEDDELWIKTHITTNHYESRFVHLQ